ncbi:sensor histidine kinase [Humitalea sp. 24SJ18S-53]|uniref:sensor histidine kinase n=1 Tax=Humitalea sp. 24SJ18S-53 TaxID=3422307 RepID=UPI003D67A413
MFTVPGRSGRTSLALVAFAGAAILVAALVGVPAARERDSAVQRLHALRGTADDADMVVRLLRQATLEQAIPDPDAATHAAEVKTTQALLADALDRLAARAAAEPMLRPQVGAMVALAQSRRDDLARPGGGDPAARGRLVVAQGRANIHAARLAADELAGLAAQCEAAERATIEHQGDRIDLALMALAMALAALFGAAAIRQRAWRAGSGPLQQAATALDLARNDAPIGMGLLDRNLVFIAANPALAAMLGDPGGLTGRSIAEATPPAARGLLPVLRRALGGQGGDLVSGSRPEPVAGRTLEIPGLLPGAPSRHWFVGIRPIGLMSPYPAGLSITVVDMTDRLRAEAESAALMRELNHRVKNTFATVQSLAAQSLRGAEGDLGRFSDVFSGRLMALARSHDLQIAEGFQGADLADVAAAALQPFRARGQIAIDGVPAVTVRPGQAQALVMALHELGTNARRHGALSVPEGRVTLCWDHLPEADGIRLSWLERGGPILDGPPRRPGFGLRLLERALEHDLGAGAEVTLRFCRAGLSCEMRFQPIGAAALVPA